MGEQSQSRLEHGRGIPLATLTAEVAHDLNNVLSVIIGRAQLVLLDLPEGSRAREDLEEIESSARASADFTRRLLIYAREQAKAPDEPDLDAVGAVVRSLLKETLRPHLEG